MQSHDKEALTAEGERRGTENEECHVRLQLIVSFLLGRYYYWAAAEVPDEDGGHITIPCGVCRDEGAAAGR